MKVLTLRMHLICMDCSSALLLHSRLLKVSLCWENNIYSILSSLRQSLAVQPRLGLNLQSFSCSLTGAGNNGMCYQIWQRSWVWQLGTVTCSFWILVSLVANAAVLHWYCLALLLTVFCSRHFALMCKKWLFSLYTSSRHLLWSWSCHLLGGGKWIQQRDVVTCANLWAFWRPR